jgi:hypothetical protein
VTKKNEKLIVMGKKLELRNGIFLLNKRRKICYCKRVHWSQQRRRRREGK